MLKWIRRKLGLQTEEEMIAHLLKEQGEQIAQMVKEKMGPERIAKLGDAVVSALEKADATCNIKRG
jgi:hypothetical protein